MGSRYSKGMLKQENPEFEVNLDYNSKTERQRQTERERENEQMNEWNE